MTSIAGTSVAFIGLGMMGRWMCRNLLAAGARLTVFNRDPRKMAPLVEAGASVAADPATAAAGAEIVILMVTDTPAVESVLLGDRGVVQGLSAGTLVIDMGTTRADATRRFAAAVEAIGGDYVDGPVSGGEIGAREGNLTIMAGGTAEALERAKTVFQVLGERLTHVGGVGAGQVAKAANQVIVGLTIGAVAEALTLARRAGVDPAKVRQALVGGFANSRVLEVHGQRMVDNKFEPGAHCTVQRKDMAQALELAAQFDLDLPATKLNLGLYESLIEAGHGQLDHAALIKAIDPDLD